MISEDTYDILMATAKQFGINRFKIEWSDLPVTYGYTDPGLLYCTRNGISYGLGMQVIPGSEVKTVATDMKNMKALAYKKRDYIAYRPIVEEDDRDFILANFASTESGYKSSNGIFVAGIDNITIPQNLPGQPQSQFPVTLETENEYNMFEFSNWYLIPIDENGNEILEIGYQNNTFDNTVKPAVETKYWVPNEQLVTDTPGGQVKIKKVAFDGYIRAAKELNIPGIRLVYNTTSDPIYYSFVSHHAYAYYIQSDKIGLQTMPGSDILAFEPDLKEKLIKRYGGDEELAQQELEAELNLKYVFWSLSKHYTGGDPVLNDYWIYYNWYDNPFKDAYIMIPLDENGNDDLRLFWG